jgi:hypothetical protein
MNADRVLDDLDQDTLAGLEQVLDLAVGELLARPGDPRCGALGGVIADVLGLGVLEQLLLLSRAEHVGDVQERRALDLGAEVDERRLHPWQHPGHFPPVDISDDASVLLAFDEELGEAPILDHRDADLGTLGVDHERVLHEGSAIRCARSGPSRHRCRDLGSRLCGSRGVGSTRIPSIQGIALATVRLAHGLLCKWAPRVLPHHRFVARTISYDPGFPPS